MVASLCRPHLTGQRATRRDNPEAPDTRARASLPGQHQRRAISGPRGSVLYLRSAGITPAPTGDGCSTP